MLYDTHAAFGAALMETILVSEHVPFTWQAGAAVGVALCAAVLPDIDHPESWITQRVDPLRIVSKTFRHRTFTHGLLMAALLYVVLFVALPVPLWLASGIFVGWMSHWIIDLTNPAGVMLFWPFPTRKMQAQLHWNGFVRNPLRPLTIPVKSPGENAVKTLLKLYALFLGALYVLAHFPVSLGFLESLYTPVQTFAYHLLSYEQWPWLAHVAWMFHIGIGKGGV